MAVKNPTAPVEQLEIFLDGLGYPGRYQVLIYVLLTFNFILISFCSLSNIFFNHVPEHRCKLSVGHSGLSKFDESYPIETRNGVRVFSKCVMWTDPRNRTSGLKKCQNGWEYKLTGKEWTVASEWDLVCERGHHLKMITTVQTGMGLIGAIIFSGLCDKFGRRPVLLFSLLMLSLSAGSIYFIHHFIAYIIIKGLQGFLGAGLFMVSFIMCMEVLPIQYRTHGAIGIQVISTCSVICLVLTNYFIRHWRYVQLSITVPFTVTIMYIWLIPESLRWLMTESRLEDSKCSIQRLLRYNKLPVQENLVTELRRLSKLRKTYGRCKAGMEDKPVNSHAFWDLFRTPEIRKRTLIMFTNWFTSALAYSLLNEVVPPLTQSKYVDIVVASLVEAGSTIIILLIVKKFDCRIPLCCCYSIAGILGILSAVLPRVIGEELLITQMIAFLSLLGKTLAFVTLSLSQLYLAELMPTTLRGTGFGLSLLWAKVGEMLGPQIFLLQSLTIPAVPFVCIGALNLQCCVLTAFLPSTRLAPLPGTVDDIDEPKSTNSRRPFVGVYTVEGPYLSRTQDVIRKEAVIKSVSTSSMESSTLSVPQNNGRVRFTQDVIDVSSNSSTNLDNSRSLDISDSDSDDGGFTTFGKTSMKRQRENSIDSIEPNMTTFIKTNPLLMSDKESSDDDNIATKHNLDPSPYIDNYSPHFFLKSKSYVDLDTAVL